MASRPAVEVCPDGLRSIVAAGACRVGVCGTDPVRLGDLASYLDHTLLKPDATVAQIDALCLDAIQHRFASVCVNGSWVRRCAEILEGSGVLVCSVIGFPLGAMAPEVKAYEARRAAEDGACEIDMVLAVGALKGGDNAFVRRDIAGVAEVCHRMGARLKVILETGLLTRDEIIRASELAKAAGADFVKTSTGFSKGGATVEHVELMRATVGPTMGVKASGGVRDQETAQAMIAAGATRIGASASIEIVRGDGGASGAGY
ncbi:MAG: deoxyribose-phosphate aldolase [bacterium]|nr:deoxyribose-phosphate aldolase [bacterium]